MKKNLLLRILLMASLMPWAEAADSYRLAITEVMTKTTMKQYPGFRGTDYWELTNFGTNDVNLTGWRFRDSHEDDWMTGVLDNIIIRAGETIVLVNTSPSTNVLCCSTDSYQLTPDASTFRQWWGTSNLAMDLQIRCYRGPRFFGGGDELVLQDRERNTVDAVFLGEASPGRSFVYDPESGVFGKISAPGEDGAFKAALADDYGSPGMVTGFLPLRILQQPVSLTNNIGTEATFTLVAGGVPQPNYQWTFQGLPLTNAITSSLTISNLQPFHAGDYQVIVSNSSTQSASAVATLTVDPSPYVRILRPPADLTAYEGQTAYFSVLARGYPEPPSYQWQADGVNIPGATDSLLAVHYCTLAMSGTVYSVRVWNQHSSTNAAARLIVTPRPKVAFTEIMNCASVVHADWFELTNYGTNSVDLQGYRISDRLPTNGQSFASFVQQSEVFTITKALVIRPRESIVFAHKMPSDEFARWWGRDNLPPKLQVHPFSGFALSGCGEQIYLWNAAATDAIDRVATAAWVRSTESVSLLGDTFFYDAEGFIGDFLYRSSAGMQGAWAAREGGDVGSPGLTEVTGPHFLGISREAGGIRLKCRGNEGKTYHLSFTQSLGDERWTSLTNWLATDSMPFMLHDNSAGASLQGFYRLEELEDLP